MTETPYRRKLTGTGHPMLGNPPHRDGSPRWAILDVVLADDAAEAKRMARTLAQVMRHDQVPEEQGAEVHSFTRVVKAWTAEVLVHGVVVRRRVG